MQVLRQSLRGTLWALYFMSLVYSHWVPFLEELLIYLRGRSLGMLRSPTWGFLANFIYNAKA